MSSQTRKGLLESIASTIADYRQDEISSPTAEHIDKWVSQFDAEVQLAILSELDHVLKRTYVSKSGVEEFLSELVKSNDLVGNDPCAFWKSVRLLDIQGAGNSQHEMLEMFDRVLQKACGVKIQECGPQPQHYLYLDDGVFSGNRLKSDLISWIATECPIQAHLIVIVIALHRGGQHYSTTAVQSAARQAAKKLEITWGRYLEIEDRKPYITRSDVLRPTCVPDDELTKIYVAGLRYPPVLRSPGHLGENRFFSSEEGRSVLEQEFLKAGVRIRLECSYLNKYQRPLGNMVLETLGFGSFFVTFRNCPNNCPLVLWVDSPWYPLFPRKTN